MSALGEDATDQQAAVAVGRVFFAAHQRNREFLNTGLKANNRCLKTCVVTQLAIEHVTCCVIISGVGRTPA